MFWKLLLFSPLLFAVLPSTTNYQLNSYGFGSGGTANSSTANYSLEGISGELSGQTGTTANYSLKPGYIETQQADVPKVTLTNPSSYNDKLKFVIDEQGNPSDALYALQVKVNDVTCDFTTGTIRYVKNDDTLGTTLTVADYQTYAVWGGAGGANMIGLASNTTYCIRAKATQGQFTESGYGPSTSAATATQQISFCLYTGASCGLGSNTVAFGAVNVNTVTNSPNNIGTDFATNADNGGSVYIYSINGGLKSTSTGYTITSATANLAVVSEGFGAQILSVSQSTGGPLTKVSPFNGSSNNVGALTTTVATLLDSATPLTGGTASTQLQVRPSYASVAKSDYSETLTVIAAGNF
jgi:hypothetical protein